LGGLQIQTVLSKFTKKSWSVVCLQSHLLHFYVTVITPVLENVFHSGIPSGQKANRSFGCHTTESCQLTFLYTYALLYIIALVFGDLPTLQSRRLQHAGNVPQRRCELPCSMSSNKSRRPVAAKYGVDTSISCLHNSVEAEVKFFGHRKNPKQCSGVPLA